MAANGRFGQLRTLPSRKSRSRMTVCRASCRPGQACYHHHRSKKPVAFADLVEPASLLVLAIAEPMKSPAPITAAVALPMPPSLHLSLASDGCSVVYYAEFV